MMTEPETLSALLVSDVSHRTAKLDRPLGERVKTATPVVKASMAGQSWKSATGRRLPSRRCGQIET
jgi:hypothetical protein